MDFVPIEIDKYVRTFVKNNRGEVESAVRARILRALKAYQAGARCHCGEPIWVIGSAEVGHACFTCITGEAEPSGDYEIAEACHKVRAPASPVPSKAEQSGRDLTDDEVPF